MSASVVDAELSLGEFARHFGVTERQVRRWIRARLVRARRNPSITGRGHIAIPRSEIARIEAAGRNYQEEHGT